MQCAICKHGRTEPSEVTVTLERPGATVVFRHVPAEVCDSCGEQYVDEPTTSRLLKQANVAAKSGVELEIRAYAATSK
ncbi:MAG: type II toxin-antitoxin system MqsA family antitoxin [Phycisphaerales bacterium]|nr:type II toxin-antitoxin system MqsA family antitoxin [Phycisphaerales bacterium]